MTIDQQPRPSVLCSWCGKLVDPHDTRPVAVRDDDNEEHITGTEPVCSECLEVPLMDLEFEVELVRS